MEGNFLPPCASVLQQNTNRTNHIARKLLSSWTSHPPISNPLNCGWELSNGLWKVKSFEGDNDNDNDENGKVCFYFLVG